MDVPFFRETNVLIWVSGNRFCSETVATKGCPKSPVKFRPTLVVISLKKGVQKHVFFTVFFSFYRRQIVFSIRDRVFFFFSTFAGISVKQNCFFPTFLGCISVSSKAHNKTKLKKMKFSKFLVRF